MLVAELYQRGLTMYYKLCVTGHCNKDYTIAATDVYLVILINYMIVWKKSKVLATPFFLYFSHFIKVNTCSSSYICKSTLCCATTPLTQCFQRQML